MPISIAGSGAVTGASTLNGLSVPTDSISPALVLISSQTFASSSSIIFNNCFSSSYDNYQIRLENITGTVGANFLMRLRSSGTSSSTNYVTQKIESTGTSVSANGSLSSTAFVALQTTSNSSNSVVDLFGPFLLRPTTGTGLAGYNQAAASSIYVVINAFGHSISSSYDSLEFVGSSGTISGTIRIYGYRKA